MTTPDEFDTNIDLKRQPDREMNIAPQDSGKTLTIAGIVIVAALVLGAFIAVAPDVKTKLDLSDEQQKRIDKLEQELAAQVQHPHQGGGFQ